MATQHAFDFEEGDAGPSMKVTKTKKFSSLVLPEAPKIETPPKGPHKAEAKK